ncbi:MAG: autoinducer binding domain-containing protein [Rhodobacteraceae bacterium]|nr:autoinducer binding domain-containing protein [Paracoccaceae bacterium]
MEAFLDRVEQCNTFEDLYFQIGALRDLFQINHVVYHSVNRQGDPFALATYGAEWANYYEKEELYKIDPVVLSAFERFHPYNWKNLSWDKKHARRMLLDAIDGGVGNQGVSVPIRGPHGEFSLFSLSHSCTDEVWARFVANYMSDLLLVGHFLHQTARRIEHSSKEQEFVSLSPRESDALRLLGGGLNRGRVAEKLSISEHTLRVYIESARFKLRAANTTHAVAKAMSQGLIAI